MCRAALLTSLLVACTPYSLGAARSSPIAAFGPSQPGLGTICVIRSSSLARAVTFVVHDNRTLVGATRGDSYFCYEAEPGDHAIVSQTFDSTDQPGHTRITVVPGARYWLKQDHANHFGSITSKLEWLDAHDARQLIDGCEHKVLTEVAGHESLPPPIPFAPAIAAR